MIKFFEKKEDMKKLSVKSQPAANSVEIWLENQDGKSAELSLESISRLDSNSVDPNVAQSLLTCLQNCGRLRFSADSSDLSQDILDVFSRDEIETPLFSINNNRLNISYLAIAAARSGNLLEVANIDDASIAALRIPDYSPLKALVKAHNGVESASFGIDLELMDLNGVEKKTKSRKGHFVTDDEENEHFVSPFLNKVMVLHEAHLKNRKTETYKSDSQLRFNDLADIRQAALKAEIRIDPFIKAQNIVFIKTLPYVIGRGLDDKVVINPAMPPEHSELDRHFQSQLSSADGLVKPDLINVVSDGNQKTRIVLSTEAWSDVNKIKKLQSDGQDVLERVIENPTTYFGRKPRSPISNTFSNRVNGFVIGKLTSNKADSRNGNDWTEGYEGNSTLLRATDGSTIPLLYSPMPIEYQFLKAACKDLEESIESEVLKIRMETGATVTPVPDFKDKKILVQGLGEFNLKELQTCCKRIEYSNTVEIEDGQEELARETIKFAEQSGSVVVKWGKAESGDDIQIPLKSLKNALPQSNANSSENRVSLGIGDQESKIGIPPSWHFTSVDLQNFSKPPGFRPEFNLEEHQRKGFAWLAWLFEHSIQNTGHSHRGALLADDMGLGKTLQLLSFVAWLRSKPDIGKKPVLIVAPVSLIQSSWLEDGFKKFFDENSVLGITSGGLGPIVRFSDCPIKVDRDLLLAEANRVNFDLLKSEKQKLSDCDIDEKLKESLDQVKIWASDKIIITSYESLRINSFTMGSIDFGAVILDEAQKIKNVGVLQSNAAKALKADMCIAMTGTPIENSLMDLWSIMDFVLPGHIGTQESFKKNFVQPVKQSSLESLERKTLKSALEKALSPVWFRRTKAEVFSSTKALPPIVHYDQFAYKDGSFKNVDEVDMPDDQFSIYETHLAYSKNAKAGHKLQAIRAMIEACAAPWLATNEPLRWSNRDRIFSLCPKLKRTMEILSEIRDRSPEEGQKVIIFANVIQIQMGLAFFIFEWNNSTSKNSIQVEVYNGDASPSARAEMLSNFKKQNGFQVLIISPKAGGAGLNIVEVNNVIHYTREWNPALERQATDRVYRMGQKRKVHVYYPTTSLAKKGLVSAEERLAGILSAKRDIMDDFTISASDHNFSESDFSDIVDEKTSSDKQINPENLHLLDPYSFECLIACLYEKMGYKSFWCGKSGDGGADVMALKGNTGVLIQAKHSQANSLVGTAAIIQVRGAHSTYESRFNVTLKLVAATNFKFSEPTVQLSRNGVPVELIEFRQLKDLLKLYPICFSEVQKKKAEGRKLPK